MNNEKLQEDFLKAEGGKINILPRQPKRNTWTQMYWLKMVGQRAIEKLQKRL